MSTGPLPAAAARAEAERVARAGTDPLQVSRDVVAALGRRVPFARWCALVLDPATAMNTAGYHAEGLPPETLPRLLELEAPATDVNNLPALARDAVGVGSLSRATGQDPAACARFREVLEPAGLGVELRAVVRDRGRPWGAFVLFRETGDRDFDDAELALVAAVAPVLGRAVRRSLLLAEAARHDAAEPAAPAPGIVLLAVGDGLLEVRTASRAARAWLADVPDGVVQPSGLPVGAVTLVHRALAAPEGTASLRLRTRSGRWASLHAEVLERGGSGEPAQVSLVLEAIRPQELAEVIADAYDLTAREREVAGLAVRGCTNREIAAALWLSPHTVQDHLKKVFAKLDVGSRAELTARLFFDQYLPRQLAGRPLGGDGWYSG